PNSTDNLPDEISPTNLNPNMNMNMNSSSLVNPSVSAINSSNENSLVDSSNNESVASRKRTREASIEIPPLSNENNYYANKSNSHSRDRDREREKYREREHRDRRDYRDKDNE